MMKWCLLNVVLVWTAAKIKVCFADTHTHTKKAQPEQVELVAVVRKNCEQNMHIKLGCGRTN